MRLLPWIAAISIVGLAFVAAPASSPGSPSNAAPPSAAAAPVVAAAPRPAAPVVAAPADPPLDPPLALPAAGPPAPAVEMGWCAASGCELVFTFSAPHPDARVVFEPAQRGKQAWRSPTELVFTPERGALLAGHEVTVTIAEAAFEAKLVVPFFEAAGKVASWPVEPGQPRFVAFLNGFVSHLGRGPLFLLYDQPVDPAAIARGVKVSTAGKPVGFQLRRPASTAQIYDHPIAREHLVTLELDALPPDGETVTIELPSRDDAGAVAATSYPLMVNTTLTASSFTDASDDDGSGGAPDKGRRTPLAARWTIALSNQVTAKQFAAHVAIEPRPRAFATWVRGTRGEITATLEPGVLYQLTVDSGLRDVLGNALRAPVVASFRAQDKQPALALPHDALVIEPGHGRLPVQVTNLGKATMIAQRFATAAAWIAARTASTPCTGDDRPVELTAPLNERALRELALDPGLYCVAIAAAGRGSEHGTADVTATTYVQVSGVGVTAKLFDHHVFAWVTRLADGKPVDGARLAVADATGHAIAQGKTASDGTATLAEVSLAGPAGLTEPGFLIVNDGELVMPLVDDQLSQPRQYGFDGRADADALAAAVFTERGVYRPGELVHVRSLVRDPDTLRPARGRLAVAVVDPRGEQLSHDELALDGFGGAGKELALKDDAKVGEYTITATLDGRAAVRRFRVEEYRVPTFAVAIDADQPWLAGRAGHARIAASYLHGGALAGRDVSWTISRIAEPFAPPGAPGFVFDGAAATGLARAPESLSHGAGRLDGQGRLVVALTPDHAAAAGPMRYVVEASVSDVDRQVYAGKRSQVVHPAELYVGVAPPARTVVAAGDTVTVPIVAASPDGALRAGVEVAATLERVDYHGVTRVAGPETQRLNRAVPTIVRSCAITTRAVPVECKLVVGEAGEYVVRAAARDARHRAVEAAFRISASGGNAVAWPRFDHERIAIVADKPSYRAGDVARLVIQSPFPRARGLVTIERAGVIEHRLLTIDGDTPEVRIPITDAFVPNVYASVVLIRGRIHDAVDATGYPTGAPAFRMGYAQLRVEPTAHRLDVAVKPSADKAFPGSALAVALTVRDAAGKPRAGQATVMVVDEAVLGLTRFPTPDPLAEIFAPRPLAVRTGESRLDLATSRRSRREAVFPGGDGGDGGEPRELEELPADLRHLFKSTAFYDPAVPVDADGHARVTFTLPDNVTTYRVMAVVVDGDTRAGAGQARVVAAKPLIVLPVLPRFVHAGDHLRLEARVQNGTDARGTVELAATLSGIALDGAPATARADAAAGGEARFAFPVVVGEEAQGRATVRFVARLGAHRDAVELTLPIVDPGASRKLVVSRQITGSDQLVVPLPADRRPGSMKVEIVASTTALSQLKDAVSYLMEYPNGCIEQTTSTAYPLVVLKELLPEIGVTVDPGELKKFAEAGVKRILSFQTTSGGLSYWPGGSEPHAFATAFGLTALIEARKRGFDVPDAALVKMADYLESALRQGKITGEMPHGGMADADTRALFVMTLGRLGRPQVSYVSTLWAGRDQLTPFGLAFLAVAVAEGAGDRALLAPILAAVTAPAKRAPTELYYEGNPRGGWSFDSPLRTHAGALLAYAVAGQALGGDARAKLLTGLLARQQGGMWGNTQENVFGVMAVAKLVGASSDAPSLTVRINGVELPAARLHATTDKMKRIELTDAELGHGDKLVVEIANGGKPVFATLRLSYLARLDGANRAPRSAGFTVTRRYEAIDGTPLDRKLRLGALVRVRLRVDAAAGNHYVAIDDKLPAGLEPLNAALATSEAVAAGALTPAMARARARLSYSELRDARVAFYLDDLPAGSYELVYVARATTAGKFVRPAAVAEAMYQPDVSGASAIDDVVVE